MLLTRYDHIEWHRYFYTCGNMCLRFNEICSVQFRCYTLEKVYLYERTRKLPDDIMPNSGIF